MLQTQLDRHLLIMHWPLVSRSIQCARLVPVYATGCTEPTSIELSIQVQNLMMAHAFLYNGVIQNDEIAIQVLSDAIVQYRSSQSTAGFVVTEPNLSLATTAQLNEAIFQETGNYCSALPTAIDTRRITRYLLCIWMH